MLRIYKEKSMEYRVGLRSFVVCALIAISSFEIVSCGIATKEDYPSMEVLQSRVNAHLTNQQYSDVLKVCDSIISIDSTGSWGPTRKSVALYHLGKYSESIILLDAVLSRDSNSFEAHCWRGNGRKITGDTVGALSDYNQALRLDPNSAIVLNSRGNLYTAINKKDSAMNDFKKAVEVDSTFLLGWSNLAILYSDLGFQDSAFDCFNKGIAVDRTGYMYHQRGLEYYNTNQYELAVDDFTMSLQYFNWEGSELPIAAGFSPLFWYEGTNGICEKSSCIIAVG